MIYEDKKKICEALYIWAAFYRLDFQKFLTCPLIKRLGAGYLFQNTQPSISKTRPSFLIFSFIGYTLTALFRKPDN